MYAAARMGERRLGDVTAPQGSSASRSRSRDRCRSAAHPRSKWTWAEGERSARGARRCSPRMRGSALVASGSVGGSPTGACGRGGGASTARAPGERAASRSATTSNEPRRFSLSVTRQSRTSARSASGSFGRALVDPLRLRRRDGDDERVEVRRRRRRASRRAPRRGSRRTRRRRSARRSPRRPSPARGSCRAASRGPCRRSVSAVLFSSSRNLAHAEVEHLRDDAPVAVLVQEDVRRLEVAVDDAAAVRGGERLGDVDA